VTREGVLSNSTYLRPKLRHRRAAVDVESLARLDVVNSQQQHDVVDLPVDGPVPFFDDVATFQKIVPSGACTTPP